MELARSERDQPRRLKCTKPAVLTGCLPLLDEFYRVTFRKKLYHTIAELQADLDAWLVEYNEQRTHQGRWCYGKTPMQTFIDMLPIAKEKLMQAA